MFITLLYNRVW